MPAEAINEALRLTTSQIYRNELEIDKKKYSSVGILIKKNRYSCRKDLQSIIIIPKIIHSDIIRINAQFF